MLTYREHVETTALKCKKGLSILKVMAAKGIEQRHLVLLYQSAVVSVTDYGQGLTTMAQTNLLKLDRVQNEAMRVILGTTRDTCTHKDPEVYARPHTDANQSESGAGHSILQCRTKSPQPTPRNRERHKEMHTMQTGMGQVLDGSS